MSKLEIKCSGQALAKYKQYDDSATYHSISDMCRSEEDIGNDIARKIINFTPKKRRDGRDNLFRYDSRGLGVFILASMRTNDLIVEDYIRIEKTSKGWMPPKSETLTLEIIEEACSDSVEYMSEMELECYAIKALKLGVMVKHTKSRKRIVAYLKEDSLDTEESSIYALAAWYQKYILDYNLEE